MTKSKIVLITGASKGIGYALTKKMLEEGFYVIGTSRDGEFKHFNDENFDALKLDLSNLDSIENATNELFKKYKAIDILINNAGIGPDLYTFNPDVKSFNRTFNVNVTGTVFLTEAVIPLIKENGIVLNVSSKMGSLNLCKLTDSVAYRMSKSALNMYSNILTNRLENKIKVASIHPGWVRTAIAEKNVNGRLSPEESAENIYRFIKSDFKNGIFWNSENDTELSW